MALLEIDSQQTFLRQLNKCMAQWVYLESSDFTFSGGGRSKAGALCGAVSNGLFFFFCLGAEAPWCMLPPASVHSPTHIRGAGQLSWVCMWGDMVAAQCPVMDEGGGGDFPRGRLAPGSYDLSRALLSFCWAPLQSHSLQRLLSQSWGQGPSDVCVCVCGGGRLHPPPERLSCQGPEPTLWPCDSPLELRWETSCSSPSRIYPCTQHQHCVIGWTGAHSFIHSFTWQFTKCSAGPSSPFRKLTIAGGRWAYTRAVQGE